jgi:hypothetical protein
VLLSDVEVNMLLWLLQAGNDRYSDAGNGWVRCLQLDNGDVERVV